MCVCVCVVCACVWAFLQFRYVMFSFLHLLELYISPSPVVQVNDTLAGPDLAESIPTIYFLPARRAGAAKGSVLVIHSYVY